MAVPVLRRILCRLPRGGAIDPGELEQEVLAAFLAAVREADPREEELDRGLLGAADRAAHRYVHAACRDARALARGEGEAERHRPEALAVSPDGEEYGVLARAVRERVISCQEARVIARSRLGGESMTALAFELRKSRRNLYRYRAAAEERLAAYLAVVRP
jgi:hypothetical protein